MIRSLLGLQEILSLMQTSSRYHEMFWSFYLTEARILTGKSFLTLRSSVPCEVYHLLRQPSNLCELSQLILDVHMLAFYLSAILRLLRQQKNLASVELNLDDEDSGVLMLANRPSIFSNFLTCLPPSVTSLEIERVADYQVPRCGEHDGWPSTSAILPTAGCRPFTVNVQYLKLASSVLTQERILREVDVPLIFSKVAHMCISGISSQEEMDCIASHLPPSLENLELDIKTSIYEVTSGDLRPQYPALSFTLAASPNLKAFRYSHDIGVSRLPIARRTARLHLPSGVRSIFIPAVFSTISFGDPTTIRDISFEQLHDSDRKGQCNGTLALASTLTALARANLTNIELSICIPYAVELHADVDCQCWTMFSKICKDHSFSWIQDIQVDALQFSPTLYVSFRPISAAV